MKNNKNILIHWFLIKHHLKNRYHDWWKYLLRGKKNLTFDIDVCYHRDGGWIYNGPLLPVLIISLLIRWTEVCGLGNAWFVNNTTLLMFK